MVVIFIVGPFYTYGALGWISLIGSIVVFFRHSGNDELSAGIQKVTGINLASMFLISFGVFLYTLMNKVGEGEIPNESLLGGFLMWESAYDAGKLPAGIGLLVWILIVGISYKFLTSPEALEAKRQENEQKAAEQAKLAEEQAKLAAQRAAEEADANQPFEWEQTMPDLPSVSDMPAAVVFTQEHVDHYLTSNREFWKGFHYNLAQGNPGFTNIEGKTLPHVIKILQSSGLQGQLDALNLFGLLKGEYLVSAAGFTPLADTRYTLVCVVQRLQCGGEASGYLCYDASDPAKTPRVECEA